MDQAGRPGDNDGPARAADGPAAPATAPTATAGERGAEASQAGGAKSASRGGLAGRGPRWLRSAVTRHLVILVAYIGAGILFTWPRATYLSGHKLPGTRDAGAYVWGFWWFARQLVHLHNPWFTNYLAAPVGAQLGFHALMPLPSLLLTPVTLAFGPSASYNVLSVLMPGLLCYAMYRAARLWVRSETAALAAGALFGLSSMIAYQSWYLVNLPAGELFIRLAPGGGPRRCRGRGHADRPGVRHPGHDRGGAGAAAVGVLRAGPRAPGPAAAAGPGGRGRAGRGLAAAHRDGPAGGGRRRVGPGHAAGQLLQLLRRRAAGAVRPLAQRGQVRPDGARVRVLLPRHRLPPGRPASPGHQQRGHPNFRPGAGDPRPSRARRGLAAAQRVAAGPDVAGGRGARPGPGAVGRGRPRVRAVRRVVSRRAAVLDHAVHAVRPDSRHVQLPRGGPARHPGAGGRGAARGQRGGLAALSREAGAGRGARRQRPGTRLGGNPAGPGDAGLAAEGHDAHLDAEAGRADRGRPLRIDRGRLPVRPPRRHPGLRPAVHAAVAGAGDRRPAPDRGRVHRPRARPDHRRAEQPSVLRRPAPRLSLPEVAAAPVRGVLARHRAGRQADECRVGHRLALARAEHPGQVPHRGRVHDRLPDRAHRRLSPVARRFSPAGRWFSPRTGR